MKDREAEEVARADNAADGSLSHEARNVGERVRRLGRVLATARRVTSAIPDAERDLAELRRDTRTLKGRPGGEQELLRLRALQAELFLRAVDAWHVGEPPSQDLAELGGPFASFATESWSNGRGGLVVTRDDLRLFFRVYWNRLVDLAKVHPFELTLEETRRYYLTHLLYPPAQSTDQITLDVARGVYAQALSQADPDYPGDLTRGILELRLGRPDRAQALLRTHLARHPDGRWAHVAHNAELMAHKVLNQTPFE